MNTLFKYKRVIIGISAVICLYFLYLLVNPIFNSPMRFIKPHSLSCIEHANKYYSTLSTTFGIFIGSLGLILGAFYYVNKNRIEENLKKREQQRRRLELFMNKLNDYDSLVCKILSMRIEDEEELCFVRERIDRFSDEINLMLEEGINLLGLKDSDAEEIIKIHSFVNKSEVLSFKPFEQFKKMSRNDFYSLKDRYVELMNRSIQLCYQRII